METMAGGRFEDIAVRPLVAGQAESLLRSILGAEERGLLLTDLEHVALACNPRFGDIWGVDVHAVVESDVDEVRRMVRDRVVDLESWVANLEAVYAEPSTVQTDDICLRNPEMTIRRHTRPVRGESGEIVGRLWSFEDVTDEVRFDRMRQAIHEVSLMNDPDPRTVYEAVTEVAGRFYETISLLSIRKADFLEFRAVGGPEPNPARSLPGNTMEQSYCQYCLATNHPFLVEDARNDVRFREIMPAQVGFVRYAGVPVAGPDGRPIGTMCILATAERAPFDNEDLRFLQVLAMRIASELERESRLEQLREALSRTSEELVGAQALLVEQEKLAVAGTLSASIAHNIRNILSTISLEIGMGGGNPQRTLETVRTHLDRFSILAHRLLSYARPGQIAPESVDVEEAIHRVAALLHRHFEVSGIGLEVRMRQPVRVNADPAHLDHLFVNLFMNSIQALKGPGTIWVDGHCEDGCARLTISDSGPGIATEMRDKLFTPFSTNRQNGTGLGLYSCRRICEEFSGSITIVELEGRGASFEVRFPHIPALPATP